MLISKSFKNELTRSLNTHVVGQNKPTSTIWIVYSTSGAVKIEFYVDTMSQVGHY